MAKQYKVRKKCLICKNVFYPSYAGSLYCNECKNKKTEQKTVTKAKPVKKAEPKIVAAKKPAVKTTKKPATKKTATKAAVKKPAVKKALKAKR